MKYVYVLVAICMAWMNTLSYGQGVCCSSPKPELDSCWTNPNRSIPPYYYNCDTDISVGYYNYLAEVQDKYDDLNASFLAGETCSGPPFCLWHVDSSAALNCSTMDGFENTYWLEFERYLTLHCDRYVPTYTPSPSTFIPFKQLTPRDIQDFRDMIRDIPTGLWPEFHRPMPLWGNIGAGPYTRSNDYNGIPWPYVVWSFWNNYFWTEMAENILQNADTDTTGTYFDPTVTAYYESIYDDNMADVQADFEANMKILNLEDGLPECIGDWNGDTGIDGSDITAFYTDWGNGTADINADGGTDGNDVTVFYTIWGEGTCY